GQRGVDSLELLALHAPQAAHLDERPGACHDPRDDHEAEPARGRPDQCTYRSHGVTSRMSVNAISTNHGPSTSAATTARPDRRETRTRWRRVGERIMSPPNTSRHSSSAAAIDSGLTERSRTRGMEASIIL